MTDAHCHVSCGDAAIRELLVGRDFFGIHPWESVGSNPQPSTLNAQLATLNAQLTTFPNAGVGEIGLDRLKVREIPPCMRELFEAQLQLALDLRRPVVLHGAKCWGQVVAMIKQLTTTNRQPATSFLFHGFSRSDGLLPDIVALNGFISVGPAVLNDHAVNYRALVKRIPLERLLVETDRTKENATDCPSIRDVLSKVAALRGIAPEELERVTDENADRFLSMQ